MARFLFTTIISNDLGPISRAIPFAQDLVRLGCEVAFCNPAKIPAQIISDTGFQNLPWRSKPSPKIWADMTTKVYHVNHGLTTEGFIDPAYIRGVVSDYMSLMQSFEPDVVIDIWNMRACIAAKSLGLPLISIMQADLHPLGQGLIWWEDPPDDLPNALPIVNSVLPEFGLPAVETNLAWFWVGDLTLIMGTPDTDPLPPEAEVQYVGPLQLQPGEGELPAWVFEHKNGRPLVWVYPGNPNYGGGNRTPFDSLVVLQASVEGLAELPVQVILTGGYQRLSEALNPLPEYFRCVNYLPGNALAASADLLIHHGGHGSYLTGLRAGTPALAIPTYSERESNGRRLAQLGVGDFILPEEGDHWEEIVSPGVLREKALSILSQRRYRQNAKRVAQNMQKYGGAVQAAEIINDFIVKEE